MILNYSTLILVSQFHLIVSYYGTLFLKFIFYEPHAPYSDSFKFMSPTNFTIINFVIAINLCFIYHHLERQ